MILTTPSRWQLFRQSPAGAFMMQGLILMQDIAYHQPSCRFNVEAAVEKTCALIAEAGANGAELVAFPELWIPGYPNFIYAHAQKTCNEYIRKYFRNSVSVDSKHMGQIRLAARRAKMTVVVLGIAEREKGSLYMAQSFIGPDGQILLHRRKFKPTSYERILFGDAV